jgi:GeoRSP system SPASM domain protein
MELATPISIYWDLPETADTGSLLRICTDIIACRPLMLNLREPGPAIGEGAAAVLERLDGEPIRVSLTLPVTALEGTAPLLRDPDRVELLLAVGHPNALAAGTEEEPGAVGVSFTVTRENWLLLPALVATCRERRMLRLVLPMQRLYNGESPFFLDRREQLTIATALAAAGGVAGMNLTIHDPFVWRAFNPGLPFPQGGCQAANTMLAIAPSGDVYPCPTLPVVLGNLGEASLKEIMLSPVKKEVRRLILTNPADCRACGELSECRGGCRGRGYAVHGSLAGADAACGRGVI